MYDLLNWKFKNFSFQLQCNLLNFFLYNFNTIFYYFWFISDKNYFKFNNFLFLFNFPLKKKKISIQFFTNFKKSQINKYKYPKFKFFIKTNVKLKKNKKSTLHLYFNDLNYSLNNKFFQLRGLPALLTRTWHNIFQKNFFKNIFDNLKVKSQKISSNLFTTKEKNKLLDLSKFLPFNQFLLITKKIKSINKIFVIPFHYYPIKINLTELFKYSDKILFLSDPNIIQTNHYSWIWSFFFFNAFKKTQLTLITYPTSRKFNFFYSSKKSLFPKLPQLIIKKIKTQNNFFFFDTSLSLIKNLSDNNNFFFIFYKKFHNFNFFKFSSSKLSSKFYKKFFKFQFTSVKNFFNNSVYLFKNKKFVLNFNCFTNKYLKSQINLNLTPSQIFTWDIEKKSHNIQNWFIDEKKNINSAYDVAFITPLHFFFNTTFQFSSLIIPEDATPHIKRKLYSFIEPNELVKFIINRHFNPLITNTIFKQQPLSDIDLSEHNNYMTSQFDYWFFNNISLKTLPASVAHQKWNIEWEHTFSSDDSDFTIKRVRFKPGYMRIWRTARFVLKNLIGLKNKYQYRITRYLFKFNYLVRSPIYLFQEFQLQYIILSSRLLLSKESVILFIQNGNTFINGIICINPQFQLYVSDFIQCLINLKYYIMFRTILNYSYHQKIKFKYKTRRKLEMRVKENDPNAPKMTSYHLPSWLMFHKYWTQDIPSHLEVDYFTLSIFIVYDPLYFSLSPNIDLLDLRYGIMNMYNWKYIT